MSLQVYGTVRTKICVEPLEVLEELKRAMNWEDTSDRYLRIVDNKLLVYNDISYHGSPCYEQTTISEDPEVLKAYDSLNNLMQYLRDLKRKKE